MTAPNPVRCAAGFGLAGTGVGSVVGMSVGAERWRAAEAAGAEPGGRVQAEFEYGWLFTGVAAGFVVGAALGVAYALAAQRRRGGLSRDGGRG